MLFLTLKSSLPLGVPLLALSGMKTPSSRFLLPFGRTLLSQQKLRLIFREDCPNVQLTRLFFSLIENFLMLIPLSFLRPVVTPLSRPKQCPGAFSSPLSSTFNFNCFPEHGISEFLTALLPRPIVFSRPLDFVRSPTLTDSSQISFPSVP